MIIEIKQIKNNFKIEFEIYENENLINLGKCSRVTSILTNQLLDIEGNLVYKTEFDPIKEVTNSIPFKWLWSKKKSDVNCIIDSSGKRIGKIEKVTERFFKSYHSISYYNNVLKIYRISLGTSQYHMIYLNDVQIGMIVKKLYVKDNLDQYKLYLLDDYKEFSTVLSLYVLYYDNFYYGNRDEIVAYKVEKTLYWSFSATDKYFNPSWLNQNFELPEVEYEKIKKQGTIFAIIFSACFLIILFLVIYIKFYHASL